MAYYVMRYVAGESLPERLHRETRLPVVDAMRFAVEIASALRSGGASSTVSLRGESSSQLLGGNGRPSDDR